MVIKATSFEENEEAAILSWQYVFKLTIVVPIVVISLRTALMKSRVEHQVMLLSVRLGIVVGRLCIELGSRGPAMGPR